MEARAYPKHLVRCNHCTFLSTCRSAASRLYNGLQYINPLLAAAGDRLAEKSPSVACQFAIQL